MVQSCCHFQVVMLHRLASLCSQPFLRTVETVIHNKIGQIGAIGTGMTTIMHRRGAVQAADRGLWWGIPWLNFVKTCLDLKLEILLHCCVIFQYQDRVMSQEWRLRRLSRYDYVYTKVYITVYIMVYCMVYITVYTMVYTVIYTM